MNATKHNSAFRQIVTGVLVSAFALDVMANPTGMTVQRGTAGINVNGSQLTVTAGNNAFLNWQSFNIASRETTVFQQPSASSVVWNRVNDPNPSQIYGNLEANGVVVLMNSSGFYFGPNSFVSAAGLVVSTAQGMPPQNNGGAWEFNGTPPLASIINYGRINIGQGGSAFLIAENIENHGEITAPGGNIGFGAGGDIVISDRPDGRGLSMKVNLPGGMVDNYGNLVANGGTISLNAQVVNQNGLVQADSVQNQNGIIELVASDQLNLGASSQILTRGDDSTGGSSGGTVTLQSGNNFSDSVGSRISVAGGSQGGNGGNVEVSAPNVLSLNSSMDAGAQAGWSGGTFFLDPANIILGTSGNGTVPNNGTVAYNSGSGTLSLNVDTAFANKNFSQIDLQASDSITLSSGTVWDLSASTGVAGGQLKLQAGNDIVFGDGSQILDANNWSVTLQAGYNFVNNTVQSGHGNIYLNGGSGQTGGGSIQTSQGSINLTAGQDITVGSGFVITTGGGDIAAHALAGNIGTGSDAQGYAFQSSVSSLDQAYNLSDGLGGISTAGGGNVSLTAGGNVTSVLPGKNGYFYDGNFFSPLNSDYTTAGSGAYGSGDVTIVAGGDVTGHYLAADGTGHIYAGVQMDANGNPIKDVSGNYVLGIIGSAGTDPSNPNLALSLINGGWSVTAAQNIILQEVRNPNGVFDISGGAAFNHAFDYAPGDYVNLSAGNMVQLGGSSSLLPRLSGIKVPVIYPSILNVSAGAGGVVFVGDSFFNQLILFPSPQGSLAITTTDGGSLTGNLPTSGGAPQIFNLIVSDSGRSQFTSSGSFGLNDHAATPIHLDQPTPITLNISGDMSLVLLGAPEAAQINVGGDMKNSRFQGMNLSAGDVTSIHVTGDIINRSAFTSIDLSQVPGAQAPDLSLLSDAVTSDPSAATLATSFFYNPTTHILTYQNIPGQNVASILQLVQNLPVQQVDSKGHPEVDSQGNPIIGTVSVLDAATAQALLAQYNALGGIPAGASGYALGGGGQFDISARSIDLGTSTGIQSKGVGLYKVGTSFPLASLFDHGADISVTTTGDLNMYSSSIGSLNGGKIQVNAGGNVNVGSSDFSVTALGARGIYSTAQGDVSVYADKNINVNGSRIAAYDGGNVTVESFNGDVNAGTGGDGFVVLSAFYVDPATRQVFTDSPTIPGSGILATTFPKRDATYPAPAVTVGNILVEAPNGKVNANAGGIVQLALNENSGKGVSSPGQAQTLVQQFLHGKINLNELHEKFKHRQPTASGASSIVEVLAGYELQDANGNPVTAANIANGTPKQVSADRNLDATGSGVIGDDVILEASGDVTGVIFARGNLNVSAQQNVNVTALSEGTANISAGDTISGTIIGVGGINASGSSIDASLLSNNSISGTTTGQSGLSQGTAANGTSQGMQAEDSAKAPDSTDATDDDLKKKGKGVALAARSSRVTVLLPQKN